MSRITGAKNKSKSSDDIAATSNLKSMEDSVSNDVLQSEDSEDEESSSQAIIMLGDNFRILVSRLNNTIQEKVKVVNKETKEESEQWKFRAYCGTIENAVKEVKKLVTYNKVHDKKLIANVSELVDIMRESDRVVEKWFKGVGKIL